MPFNSNFTGATLGGGALTVEGTSDVPDAVTAISVILCHGDALISATVDNPTVSPWKAVFAEPAAQPFKSGGDAAVVGVALLGGRPLIWEGVLQIK